MHVTRLKLEAGVYSLSALTIIDGANKVIGSDCLISYCYAKKLTSKTWGYCTSTSLVQHSDDWGVVREFKSLGGCIDMLSAIHKAEVEFVKNKVAEISKGE